MPHVLYNHLSHAWDDPDPGHGWTDAAGLEESPHFGPRSRRLLPRMALGVAALFAGFVAWGLLAGLFLELSQK